MAANPNRDSRQHPPRAAQAEPQSLLPRLGYGPEAPGEPELADAAPPRPYPPMELNEAAFHGLAGRFVNSIALSPKRIL
jgi:hypothetical protein